MTESLRVHCFTLVTVCFSVRDDGLPVDPQGLDREQVYCSVLQPCQDTQQRCASDVRFSTPLPLHLPLSYLMSLSLLQPSYFPIYPSSLCRSFYFLPICFLPLFNSSPPTPKGSNSHSFFQFLSVPKPAQMSWGQSVASFQPENILLHDLLLIGL